MAAALLPRPFPISFEATDAQGGLEIALDFAAPAGDEARRRVEEVLTSFGGLGAVGGFAGRDIDPGRSGLTLDEQRTGPWGAVWRYRDVRIDPASLFIAANMVHYIHLEDVPLRLARILCSDEVPPGRPNVVHFPELWRRPSFRLDFGDLLDDLDVVVRLQVPQTPDRLARIVDAMSAWLLATHRGAYADDSFDPSETAVFLGPDVMDVRPDCIVWYIDIMRCNENAVDGLLNVLEWAHQHVAAIASVEVGP
jgi:hypothetical protein